MKTTCFLITSLLIVCLSVDIYSQGNTNPKTVFVNQVDPRFTLSVERLWLTQGKEEYWFYVQNNTSQEYKLTINITLDLACVGTKSFDLGIDAWRSETKTNGRMVYLEPNGRFGPKNDYFHYWYGGVDNGKACRLKDDDSYTLFKGIQFNISSVINVTEQKALDDKKKKDADAFKQQQLEKEKKDREATAKAAADKLEKEKKDRETTAKAAADKKAYAEKQSTNSNTNNSSKGGSNTQTNSSNSESVKTNSTQNSNNQSGEITNMSDYVGTVDRYNSIKVYKQNDKYYVQNQNGSSYETTKQEFDKIHAVSANNNRIKENNAKIQNDPLANYNAPTNNSNPMTNSNTSSSSNNNYTEAAQSIGSAITQLANHLQVEQAAREQREMQRREAEERREAAAAEARANKRLLVSNRKTLIAQFPDCKTPLSYEAKGASDVYYFVYSYQAASIENDRPAIYISNVFSLAKYGDGTWPLKASLMENIAKNNQGLNLILSGYYLDKNEANQKQQLLLNGANDYGFAVNNINYVNKKSTSTSESSIDYWGNPVKKENQQGSLETPNSQEPAKPKPKTDYWGNPIKE